MLYVGADNVSAVQILTNTDTGVITLSGSKIYLNAHEVYVNGLSFTCNANFIKGKVTDSVTKVTSAANENDTTAGLVDAFGCAIGCTTQFTVLSDTVTV